MTDSLSLSIFELHSELQFEPYFYLELWSSSEQELVSTVMSALLDLSIVRFFPFCFLFRKLLSCSSCSSCSSRSSPLAPLLATIDNWLCIGTQKSMKQTSVNIRALIEPSVSAFLFLEIFSSAVFVKSLQLTLLQLELLWLAFRVTLVKVAFV